MEKLLDQDFKTISTPVDAEKHYTPFIQSGEMDLMAVKKELREVHHFEEADVRISANVLSKIQLKTHIRKDGQGYSIFGIGFGTLLVIVGMYLAFFLNERGFISFVAYGLIGGGISMVIASIVALKKK